MRLTPIVLLLGSLFVLESAATAESRVVFSGVKRQNNLVAVLLEVAEISQSSSSFDFKRGHAGYIFVTADCRGKGTVTLKLDDTPEPLAFIKHDADISQPTEAVRNISPGEHRLKVECAGNIQVEKLVVKAIPELMHCGLGFDPAIKSYGKYDLEFLKKDILPNVTTLIVRPNPKMDPAFIEDWHRQGKRLVAAVWVNQQVKTVEEHYHIWIDYFEKVPILDGIMVDEFIINNPHTRPGTKLTPGRKRRLEQEHALHRVYAEALQRVHAEERYKNKMVYAYFGGSGKILNQEVIGPTFVHSILNLNYRIGLERYIFEVSSEQKSKDVLQLFVDGITDWVAKEPTVREQMVLTFGLFSMPPGGINKQPNVDFHVWMDQQMNVVANHPVMAGMGGLNWWTSLQADEETVRFVGKLYRHYAIEGKRELLTKDPLFLTHIQNADFEKQLEGWTLHAAEEGSIQAKSFPRYGRIEGRYMGLGRPADPEHIGDTFLWMKRSEKGPNTFSQPIKDLEPGRMYSLKMFTCDYQDLINPKKKSKEEAHPFIGNISIDGVEVDRKRSFNEAYSSTPEPRIPVWITYHWMVFRAKSPTAKITVSDWDPAQKTIAAFGQEQTFNFLELEPYHE
jgi:hypothetical protein